MVAQYLHRIVAQPWVYDLVQRGAGANIVYSRIAAQAALVDSGGVVLDLGGGTGLARRLWPSARTYICLDLDLVKLQGFMKKAVDGSPLLADATRIPLLTASVDVILCVAVAHHIDDVLVDALIEESSRVLKNGGTLFFLDPIWANTRLLGRLLWKYDRGSHPRTPDTLQQALSRRFECLKVERFAVFHEYLFWIGRPRPQI